MAEPLATPGALGRARIAARVAVRSLLAAPGRSILIVLLLALPVALMAAATVAVASAWPTPEERAAMTLGEFASSRSAVSTEVIQQDPTRPDEWYSPDPIPAETSLATRVAEDAVVTIAVGHAEVDSRAGVASIDAVIGPAWDLRLAPRYDLVAGAAPATAAEVGLSRAAMDRLGVGIGDTMTAGERRFHVVAELRDATRPASVPIVFTTATAALAVPEGAPVHYATSRVPLDEAAVWNRAGVAVADRTAMTDPRLLESWDIGTGYRAVLGAVLVPVALFCLFEVGLLAGTAIASGVRRDQRMLAMLAITGAPPATLRLTVLLRGAFAGVLGASVGTAGGIGLGVAVMTIANDGSSTRFWGLHLDPVLLGAIALFAILCGIVAAAVPARMVARQESIDALRGSRRPAKQSVRGAILGGSLLAGGVVVGGTAGILMAQHDYGALWAFQVAVGAIAVQVGLLLLAPRIIGALRHVVSWFGVPARVVARDAHRMASRAAAVLTATMVTVFLAVGFFAVMGGVLASNDRSHSPSAPVGAASVSFWNPEVEATAVAAVADRMRSVAPDATIAAFERPAVDPAVLFGSGDGVDAATPPVVLPRVPAANLCPMDPRSSDVDAWTERYGDLASPAAQAAARADARCATTWAPFPGDDGIVIGSVDDLAAVYGPFTAAQRSLLADGGALVVAPSLIDDDRVVLDWVPATDAVGGDAATADPAADAERSETLAAMLIRPDWRPTRGLLVTTATATALGIDTVPYALTMVPADSGTVGVDQVDAVNAALRVEGLNEDGWFAVEQGANASLMPLLWGAAAAALLLILGAGAMATGLLRAESRDDDATLTAVGASPGFRRRSAFWQGLLLSLTGAVLGAASALTALFGSTVGYASSANSSGIIFAPLWLPILAITFGVPVLLGLGSWLATALAGLGTPRYPMRPASMPRGRRPRRMRRATA